MAEWVYVENNQIKEFYDRLPRSWKNISGLDKADVGYLRNLGWLPVQKNTITYDQNTHYIKNYSYEIFQDKVIETPIIDTIIENSYEVSKFNFLQNLRIERNRRLLNCDWTQTTDIQKIKNSIWITNWENYRQKLRDLPNHYDNLSSYTNVIIAWPVEPQN